MSSMPEETKKSYHQKMLRRRITTMLRPSTKTMLGELKQLANLSNTSLQSNKDCFDIVPDDNDSSLSPELRAEQLLLLSLHPASSRPPLPSVPDQASPERSWAEPGWQLIIDDPDFGREPSSILPVQTQGQLTQQLLSTCCSSGRQAASLIKPRHLRMLTDPLSAVCQGSAPAETNPSGQRKASQGMYLSHNESLL